MIRLGLVALTAGVLCACAPRDEPAAQPGALALDCSAGFEALRTQISERPGLRPAPIERGEPYRIFSEADGSASYILTEPGAPAHPAVLKQTAVRRSGVLTMENEGCSFGDAEAYAALKAYWDQIAQAR